MNQQNLAIEILRATHDGNDLTKEDLRIVEFAANDLLNDRGIEALKKIHMEAMAKNEVDK